jgi:hypothetical protein
MFFFQLGKLNCLTTIPTIVLCVLHTYSPFNKQTRIFLLIFRKLISGTLKSKIILTVEKRSTIIVISKFK